MGLDCGPRDWTWLKRWTVSGGGGPGGCEDCVLDHVTHCHRTFGKGIWREWAARQVSPSPRSGCLRARGFQFQVSPGNESRATKRMSHLRHGIGKDGDGGRGRREWAMPNGCPTCDMRLSRVTNSSWQPRPEEAEARRGRCEEFSPVVVTFHPDFAGRFPYLEVGTRFERVDPAGKAVDGGRELAR
jgi:hypothetical protein